MVFFSFFMCSLAQASVVRRAFHALDQKRLENIVSMVIGKQDTGLTNFELNRLAQTTHHLSFVSEAHHFDLQKACMYNLVAAERRQEETNVYGYEKKSIACLAMYPIKNLKLAYEVVVEQIEKDDKPWEKNWAPQYDFLKKP